MVNRSTHSWSYLIRWTDVCAVEGEPRILNAQDIACDAEGNVYVADSLRDQVLKIEHPGTSPSSPARVVGASRATGPADDATFADLERIAIAPDGAIYAADSLNNRVRRIAE
jgi:DNA-binding beta-propeller fold protein YncE